MSTVIKVENLSKQYRLGLVNSSSVKDDLTKIWHNIRGKENPMLNIGDSNDRSTKAESKYVWSLKDINFEVEQGEVLGIIGKNGAGKSTLLKILSRITTPTTGTFKSKGRIASLLEVGTGFHPELTGRENIYLNGAILGMRKAEITRKLDEIIDFSGVERYVDTPVKRYSSGMYVRLAFAVAAHLESEIMIIDEVLAVGDAEFQKKCLGKIDNVSKAEGRTVLFVSHNMQAVTHLCSNGLLLKNGNVNYIGDIESCVKNYLTSSRINDLSKTSLNDRLNRTSGEALFTLMHGFKNNQECWDFDFNEDIQLKFTIKSYKNLENLAGLITISDPFTQNVITNYNFILSDKLVSENESLTFIFSIPQKTLRTGQYSIYFALGDANYKKFYDVLDNNVNLPLLNINPISMNIYENSGYFTSQFKLKKITQKDG